MLRFRRYLGIERLPFSLGGYDEDSEKDSVAAQDSDAERGVIWKKIT
jgi:hypothetical protein